jgi:hypothetical protein
VLAALKMFAGRQAAPMANPPAKPGSASPATPTATIPATPRYRPPADAPIVRLWVPGREAPPHRRPTPEEHAARLLRWAGEKGTGIVVLAMDLQRIYPHMCSELDWAPYPWQPVASKLRNLTGGIKPYRHFDGRRRRVYFIP